LDRHYRRRWVNFRSASTSHETPQNRYTYTEIAHHGPVMTVGLRQEFEAECARGAVRNMMSDQLSNIYVPYKKR